MPVFILWIYPEYDGTTAGIISQRGQQSFFFFPHEEGNDCSAYICSELGKDKARYPHKRRKKEQEGNKEQTLSANAQQAALFCLADGQEIISDHNLYTKRHIGNGVNGQSKPSDLQNLCGCLLYTSRCV